MLELLKKQLDLFVSASHIQKKEPGADGEKVHRPLWRKAGAV